MPCDHHLRCPRALLVASGSVAAVKSLETAKILVASGFSVCVVLTNSAAHFADIRELDTFLNVWQSNHDKPLQDVYCKKLSSSTRDRGIPNAPSFEEGANVFVDADEWSLFTSLKSNDPVLHIALRDWADILIVSPASASFLADAASGRCSDLARSILRAWPGSKPLVLAPAMNTTMWHHPSTLRSLKQIVADRAEMAAVAWASGGTVSSTSFPSLSAPLPRPTALPAAPVPLPPPQLPSSAAERASSPAPTADRPDATAAGAVSAAPVLEAAGVTVVVWPVVKTLACGDTGVGALASPSVVVQAAALACSAAFAPRLPAEAEAVGAQASHAASEVPARYSLARYVDEVGAAAELVVAVDRYGISLPEVRDLHPPIISAAMCK